MTERRSGGSSVGTKAIVGLLTGLAVGAAIDASAQPALLAFGAAIEVVGTLWINAILMTILPLVVSKLIVSIAGAGRPADHRPRRRAGARAVRGAAGVGAALRSPSCRPSSRGCRSIRPLRPSLRAAAPAPAPGGAAHRRPDRARPGPDQRVRAAADGAIVPLLVFSVAFALGASRIPPSLRDPLVGFFRAVDAAITVLLHWIIASRPTASSPSASASPSGWVSDRQRAAYYVVVSSVAAGAVHRGPLPRRLGGRGVSPRRFAHAAAPAQVVAFGTHSSMASLPAMIEGMEDASAVPDRDRLRPAAGAGRVQVLGPGLVHHRRVLRRAPLRHPDRPVPRCARGADGRLTSFAVGGVPSGAVVVVAPSWRRPASRSKRSACCWRSTRCPTHSARWPTSRACSR